MRKEGVIFWNLDAILACKAGAVFPVTISVVNLTDTDKEYLILLKTLNAAGQVLSEFTFTVDGLAWFELEAEERIDADGVIEVEDTNVNLLAILIERETEKELDSVITYLKEW